MYEQLGLQFEDQFKEELGLKLNKLEEDMEFYRSKVSTCVENSLEHFRVEAVSSAPASATSSRGNSLNRKCFLNMKHLIPNMMTEDCTLALFHHLARCQLSRRLLAK